MTWLSRLLPQSPRLPRLANHNNRTRQGQRRRRMANLETLEGRTLLSNVVTSFTEAPSGALTLTILGDTHNDTFSVTENSDGTVTVAGNSRTTINSLGLPYTTSQAISDIDITLPGSGDNSDVVTMNQSFTGRGTVQNVIILVPGVSTTAPATGLNLTVTGLEDSGTLAVYDAPTTGVGPNAISPAYSPAGYTFPTDANGNTLNYLGGTLKATISGSQFSALTVEQDGCCQANVTMTGDAVAGSLTVEEGVSNNDTISLTDSTAGATTLIQGYGPAMPLNTACQSADDLVNVQDDGTATTGIFSLAITQLGPGGGESILVGTATASEVEVGLTGFGITATQDDAGTSPGNVITIESITVYHGLFPTTSFLPSGPPSIVTSQGDDSGDSTSILSSTVWGNISASQGIGNSDSVTIAADSAGYTVPGSGGVLTPEYGCVTVSQGSGSDDSVTLNSAGSEFTAVNVFNNLVITQSDVAGNSSPDTVLVDSTTVETGNIIICQGDAAGDTVTVSATSAGYTTPSGPFGGLNDYGGLLKIVQGNGYEDSVVVTPVGTEFTAQNVFNNVLIVQGDSLVGMPVDGSEPTGDFVSIDGTTINSNLFIFQNVLFGEGSTDADPVISGDGPGLGNNVVNIATTTGLPATADQAVVGDWTYIYQGGANNTVMLGGAGDPSGIDFETAFLDIYTGAGGGGFVSATFSVVDYGSYFSNNFVIDGGADGNTFEDEGVNPGFDCSPAFSYEFVMATPVLRWANPADITYGTALDGTQLDATANVAGTFTYTQAAGTVLGAGNNQSLSVTFTPTDTIDYTSATATATINVSQAQLTVAAVDEPMTYGSSVPALMYTITGFVPGDGAGVVSGTPGLSTTATSSSDPGSYPITVGVSGLSAANYSFAAQDGTLTIGTATPTISWSNPMNIVYGTTLSSTQLDATANVSGNFAYSAGAGTVLGAGTQTLSVTFTPTDTTDYTTATQTTQLVVNQATPTITWSNPSAITYGTALNGTQLDATASVSGNFAYSSGAGTVLGAGTQTLSVTFTPTNTTDYGPVTATAMINVNQATLLITATSATKVYGQKNPAFTVTYAGLIKGDSSSSLSGSLHFSTAATASSHVNTYPVVPGGLTSPNYAITFVSGNLVVTPASLTITAKNISRVYGQPNPPLTASCQGFVNGDTPASLTAPVTLSTPAVLASFAGSYKILVGGAASPNYAIHFVSGMLVITPPTDPVVLGRIAFVTSLYKNLLLTSPGPADLFSWLQQLNTGRSELYVASAINQSPAHLAVLRAHHGVGISFAVALQHAEKAQQQAIQNAR